MTTMISVYPPTAHEMIFRRKTDFSEENPIYHEIDAL